MYHFKKKIEKLCKTFQTDTSCNDKRLGCRKYVEELIKKLDSVEMRSQNTSISTNNFLSSNEKVQDDSRKSIFFKLTSVFEKKCTIYTTKGVIYVTKEDV